MGGKAKAPPMLPSEIDEMNEGLIVGNHLYSRDIDGSEKMREVIRNATKGLDRQPISLADTAAVQVTAEAYVDSCIRTPILPTRSGLSLALGHSRIAIFDFMKRNPGHKTSVYLQKLFDSFSEALDHAALSGVTQPVYSIFVQKSVYGRVDNPQFDELSDVPEPEPDVDEIARRYDWLPEE